MAELNSPAGKSGGKRSTPKMPVRVDLTAMVDLAFLLITFFMLTTSLTKPKALPLVMPALGRPGAGSDKTTMTILLGKNNHAIYYLGLIEKPIINPTLIGYGKDMRMAITETTGQVFKSTGKPMMVIIKPADHSVYANLVDALDELN